MDSVLSFFTKKNLYRWTNTPDIWPYMWIPAFVFVEFPAKLPFDAEHTVVKMRNNQLLVFGRKENIKNNVVIGLITGGEQCCGARSREKRGGSSSHVLRSRGPSRPKPGRLWNPGRLPLTMLLNKVSRLILKSIYASVAKPGLFLDISLRKRD